jgi:hypothetical protein
MSGEYKETNNSLDFNNYGNSKIVQSKNVQSKVQSKIFESLFVCIMISRCENSHDCRAGEYCQKILFFPG